MSDWDEERTNWGAVLKQK